MKHLFLTFIRFYQKTRFFHWSIFRFFYLSDAVCRYQPTCAEYTYQAVNRYGIMQGVWWGLKRICRCHPWAKGGYDPLPNLKK